MYKEFCVGGSKPKTVLYENSYRTGSIRKMATRGKITLLLDVSVKEMALLIMNKV